jgi:hypothetical protein
MHHSIRQNLCDMSSYSTKTAAGSPVREGGGEWRGGLHSISILGKIENKPNPLTPERAFSYVSNGKRKDHIRSFSQLGKGGRHGGKKAKSACLLRFL